MAKSQQAVRQIRECFTSGEYWAVVADEDADNRRVVQALVAMFESAGHAQGCVQCYLDFRDTGSEQKIEYLAFLIPKKYTPAFAMDALLAPLFVESTATAADQDIFVFAEDMEKAVNLISAFVADEGVDAIDVNHLS